MPAIEPMRGGKAGAGSGRTWRHGRAAVAALCAALVLVVPAAMGAAPARMPLTQNDAAERTNAPGQVVAQGIAKLPRGEVAWTVRRLDVPGGDGTVVESFPLGFVVADGNAVALRDDAGEVLAVLDDGEATFLPSGKSGALASWRGDTAGIYEIALVAGREASAGETPGTVVGNPFASPGRAASEIELARAVLAQGEEDTVPVAPSNAPVLFLLTTGAVQLQAPGGDPVDLATGQYAMLLGEVIVRGASDEPATFLVASIGEATGAADAEEAAGTPEAGATRADRANRADRQRTREAEAGGSDASGGGTREKRQKRERTGGGGQGGQGGQGRQGGQGVPGGQAAQETGGAPISGGVAASPAPGVPGTPAAEPPLEAGAGASPTATTPAGTIAPTDGTPTPEATIPTGDEDATGVGTPPGESLAPQGEAPGVDTVTPESTVPSGETVPTEETPAITGEEPVAAASADEATLPVEAAPATEVPLAEGVAPPADVAPTETVVEEQPVDPAATG